MITGTQKVKFMEERFLYCCTVLNPATKSVDYSTENRGHHTLSETDL